jgi:hypothetical protein
LVFGRIDLTVVLHPRRCHSRARLWQQSQTTGVANRTAAGSERLA